MPGPLDLRVLMALTDLPGFDAPRDPVLQPVDVLANVDQTDLFSLVEERPLLLHHPYDSLRPGLALVAQAADDPDVLAIKQTLYRTSVGSPLIASLQRAAERNKQVTVLVELTARFDEERNIHWARALEEAGAHVIYGVRGYKTHAKICLIVRRSPEGLKRYVHLGTGNYNERTARIYTDFGLITTSQAIAEDATAFFSAVTGYSDPPRLKKLVMAPTGLRRRFLRLIDRERRRAQAGAAGGDPREDELPDRRRDHRRALRRRRGRREDPPQRAGDLRPQARRAGPQREYRSRLCRRPLSRAFTHLRLPQRRGRRGLPGERGLDDAQSRQARGADVPARPRGPQAKVLYVLRAMFRDNVKARWLDADGIYRRRERLPNEPDFRVQQHLQEETRRLASLARERAGVTLRPPSGARPRGKPKIA